MGCATSAEARRDMVWVGGNPRARRSFSLPSVDRQRLRSKAASMLGTLGIASNNNNSGRHHYGGSCKYSTLPLSVVEEMMMKHDHDHYHAAEIPGEEEAAVKKQWCEGKPRTPTLTPPNEPEVINAWELMAGLEDGPTPRATRRQSLSLDAPPWMQVDMDIPVVALEFDPEILSGFREAMKEDTSSPSPQPPVVVSSAEEKCERTNKDVDDGTPISPATKEDMPDLSGIVRARINAFQEKIERRRSKGRDPNVSSPSPPGGERRAVVYFTSLRGVRKTFVDCCAVRAILRSYAMRLDERDVSMHAGFKAELAHLLDQGFAGAALPRVFVDGRYLGGAEEVQRLHEAGELGRALEGCDAAPLRKLGYMEACAACGDVRFVPCKTCYGSCKIFVEDDDDASDGYHDAGEFRRCPDCNENGLVRCPVCCC